MSETAHVRLFKALRGEPTERLPMWLLFPYHRVPYYADVMDLLAWRPVWERALERSIFLDRRSLSVRLFTDAVVEVTGETTEGADTVRFTELRHAGRTLRAETRSGPAGTRVTQLLETDEDLETFCSLPLDDDPASMTAQLEAQLPKYLAERAEFPAHLGAMMLDLGEPVNVLYHRSQLESYALWSLTHTELVEDWLRRRLVQLRAVYRFALERELAPVFFLVGSELASPPLVSGDTFDRWIVPFARELIDMIRAAGAFSIQHYHGRIRGILDRFVTLGPDALHTIEAPPVGDCTWAEAWDIVGDSMALIGNVQYDRFRVATADQMRTETETVLRECAGRRLILSPSAGPYEAAIDGRMVGNYLAFMEVGAGFTGGPRGGP